MLFRLCLTFALFMFVSQNCVAKQHSFDYSELSLVKTQDLLKTGQTTVIELTHYYLERIKRYDEQGPKLNSIAQINPNILAQAQALDLKVKNYEVLIFIYL